MLDRSARVPARRIVKYIHGEIVLVFVEFCGHDGANGGCLMRWCWLSAGAKGVRGGALSHVVDGGMDV